MIPFHAFTNEMQNFKFCSKVYLQKKDVLLPFVVACIFLSKFTYLFSILLNDIFIEEKKMMVQTHVSSTHMVCAPSIW